MKKPVFRLFFGMIVLSFVLVVGYIALRPFHLNWGTTNEDAARAMPGDFEVIGWTRAVTIHATPQEIWPWLMQWGQGRGGWYSYDWLENLFGFDIHTANRILPEYQNPAIGDPICMAKGFCVSQIAVIEPYQWFGWTSLAEDGSQIWAFMIGLFPVDETHTRLVVRESFGKKGMPGAAIVALEIPDAVMELKMLNTLRERVEGVVQPPIITILEIALWLAGLGIGIIAGVWMVKRPHWKAPLLVGTASAIVLLVITFLFLPLWLRALLDVGLAGGLVWARRIN